MNFLYRAPLYQFDICNSQEIENNWETILQSILLSSQHLYQAICGKKPGSLTSKEWKSVYKYLLRGKYRPTPFGKWAGVGIAKWGTEDYSRYQVLCHKSIDNTSNLLGNNPNFWINPSLERWGGGWKFWNYDKEVEKWRFSKADDGPFIQRIREISVNNRPINPDIFFCTFPDLQLQERKEVWNYLTGSQLLIPEKSCNSPEYERKEDIFISTSLSVSEIHRYKLEKFLDEINSTAVAQKRPYQEKLAKKFIEFFDDRYVPLRLLWKLVPYLNNDVEISPFNTNDFSEYLWQMQSAGEFTNLRDMHHASEGTKKPFQGQVLFRILESGQLLIDNLSFNRPFVYAGRFTYEPQIFDYFQHQVQKNDDIILADVLLCEGSKSQAISAHRNIVDHTINCFSGSSSPFEFDIEQIFIGMNGQRFELILPHLGKKLMPVFQHPLNPEYITHPLCRILWEVAHQNILRPIHYALAGFYNASYIPQLNWGDIILQPRKWKFGKEWQGKTEEDLQKYLTEKNIPQRVLVGKHDQELVLNLSKDIDRLLLIEELSKNKNVNIYECLWVEDESNTIIPTIYPQFLWGKWWHSLTNENIPSQINLVTGLENKNWISVRIVLRSDYPQHLVSERLFGLVSEFEDQGIFPYYFLYYPISDPELRFRVKMKDNSSYVYITSKLYTYFRDFAEFEQIRPHAYYPEDSKYSLEGMEISEGLFYQESKLILATGYKTETEKLSLAVGIGNLLLETSGQPEYWIDLLSKLCKGKGFHSQPDPILNQFDQLVHKKWQENYVNQLKLHPWKNTEDKQGVLLGNHLHMCINRIFWERSNEKEQEVHAILLSILRRKKFGKENIERLRQKNKTSLSSDINFSR